MVKKMRMKTLLKIWIGFVLILIVSAGMLSFWWEEKKLEAYNNTFMGSYVYDIQITTDLPLNNITLYVPLPWVNNTSTVSQSIMNITNGQNPAWEYTLVKTEHGPMLSMRTERIEPKFALRGEGPDTYSRPVILATTVFFNDTINTKNPVGNAEVLMPRYNSANLGAITSYRNAISYRYDSIIYAHYETSPDARVSIAVRRDAQNEWWIGGWQSNSYRELIITELSGPQNGWIIVNGELVTGEGTYLEE